MPIEPDPQATFPLVLDRHAHLPAKNRPTLRVRTLRRIESRRLSQILREIDAVGKTATIQQMDDIFDRLYATIQSSVVGWENQTDEAGNPLPYKDGDLERVVHDGDLIGAAVQIKALSMMGPIDRKKSESPSDCNTEGSPTAAASKSSAPSATTDPAPGPATYAAGPGDSSCADPTSSS